MKPCPKLPHGLSNTYAMTGVTGGLECRQKTSSNFHHGPHPGPLGGLWCRGLAQGNSAGKAISRVGTTHA
jgi:hypothetical protein